MQILKPSAKADGNDKKPLYNNSYYKLFYSLPLALANGEKENTQGLQPNYLPNNVV